MKTKDNSQVTGITLGADPECFIINEENGKVVSSIGIIPGEKGSPWRGKDMPVGYGLEIDNILAEFNIPPAHTKDEFVSSIEYMKEYISNFVKKTNPKYTIKCAASELVDEDQLQSDEARLFGCSVDYNIYTEAENPKPKGENTNLRSAGFHVHCGYKDPTVEQSLKLLQYFDLYLGVPSVIIDTDQRRRTLYGKAGCFRITGYGFEYRVLSSALMSSPERTGFIYDQCQKAIQAYNESAIEFVPELKKKIESTINSGNVKAAKELVKTYNICVESLEL